MLLCIEVLHGLEVQQTVRRLLVVIVISCLLSFETLGSSLGNDICQSEVNDECEYLDSGKLPTENGEGNSKSHQDFDDKTENVVESHSENHGEGLSTSRDDSDNLTGLSAEVISHGKSLHMIIHIISNGHLSLCRHLRKRNFSDSMEHIVSQLDAGVE